MWFTGFSLQWLLFLQSTCSRAHSFSSCSVRLGCSVTCVLFPDQGSSLCPLQWQVVLNHLAARTSQGQQTYPSQLVGAGGHVPSLTCMVRNGCVWPADLGTIMPTARRPGSPSQGTAVTAVCLCSSPQVQCFLGVMVRDAGWSCFAGKKEGSGSFRAS